MSTYDDDAAAEFYSDPANQQPGDRVPFKPTGPRGTGTVISCRFPDHDMNLLRDAMAINGATMSSFIRRAVHKLALEIVEEHLLSGDAEIEWGEPLEPVKFRQPIRHIWTGGTAPETAAVVGPPTTEGNPTPVYIRLENDMWAEMTGGANLAVHEGRTLVRFPDGSYAPVAV